MGNQILRRIAFIQEFLKYLEDENSIIFVLDEVGFGTKALRKYAYSPIGIPAILKKTELSHNLTCTATISFNGVEMLQFFSEGGTKKEQFACYFDNLLTQLKLKYPNQKLVFILDNLQSHKSAQTIKVMQDDQAFVLYTPSNSPQFSPIENMFGLTKKKLQDLEFKKKEQVAKAVAKTMFQFNKYQIEGFFKKTLQNILHFWFNLDRNKFINEMENI